MTREDAREIAQEYNIPLDQDYHTLSAEQVERVLAAADMRKYRKPRGAFGSRARYFHSLLCRAAVRAENQ